MLNAIMLGNRRWVKSIREKTKILWKTLCDFKERHKPHFLQCAVVYMSVKIGVILLATFTSLALLLTYVSQHIALEMTKTKALLLTTPLTLIIMLKLYFIFKMLMSYERSRATIKSVLGVIWLKGRQQMEETIPAPPLSLEKAKNY